MINLKVVWIILVDFNFLTGQYLFITVPMFNLCVNCEYIFVLNLKR